jgi:hypothetical protein
MADFSNPFALLGDEEGGEVPAVPKVAAAEKKAAAPAKDVKKPAAAGECGERAAAPQGMQLSAE